MIPESFWQEILPSDAVIPDARTPVTAAAAVAGAGYPARFEDGRVLMLPIRPLPEGGRALASLIINQASFPVVDALADELARKLGPFAPDVVIGMPTLGLTLASVVARTLGHSRYVPLGTSAKFWYRSEWSVPLTSVTTPDQVKRLFIDPRLVPLLAGRPIALIDDVVSSGASMLAAIELLRLCGARPTVLGAAMLQSDRWQQALAGWPVVSVLRSPLITLAQDACGSD